MNGVITEKDYPIQVSWLIKPIIYSVPMVFTFLLVILFYSIGQKTSFVSVAFLFLFFVISIAFTIVIPILRWLTFHYSIEDQFLTLRQGILSKQQRHIPYGVIQNLFIKQDILDRLFGIASLTVENASQGSGDLTTQRQQKVFGMKMIQNRQRVEILGFSGNMVNIPGLAKENAEALKQILLQKMKENPIEDSQSGL